MQKLARSLLCVAGTIFIGLTTAGAGRAADVAIVDVPQGMILEMRVARANGTPATPGTAVGLVVAHDLRVGKYVVIAAGSRGVGHLLNSAQARATTAARVSYDYVVASDGTRIPVAGTLPYLTTSTSRPVVIYDPGERSDDSAVPVPTLTDAPIARP